MLYTLRRPDERANWLSVLLVDAVCGVLNARAESRSTPAWADFLEGQVSSAPLRTRRGLRTRYDAIVSATSGVDKEAAATAAALLRFPNLFGEVLRGGVAYRKSLSLGEQVDLSLLGFFEFGFDLLSSLPDVDDPTIVVRDRLYQDAYGGMRSKLCPFCGVSPFEAPRANLPRHALDHYLARTIYPLFATHLENLIPMCDRCNQAYKRTSDLLRDSAGLPRSCVDPYAGPVATISVNRTEIRIGGDLSRDLIWRVDFEPPLPEFETWDSVFQVRARYETSFLPERFGGWLRDYGRWVSMHQSDLGRDIDALSDDLARFACTFPEFDDLGFLEKPVFSYFSNLVRESGEDAIRLRQLIWDVIDNA